jgi:hypothetical protein
MSKVKLTYENGLYRYDYKSFKNELMQITVSILTSAIRFSDRYKEVLEKKPYKYISDVYYFDKVDDYIILGCDEGDEKAIMPYSKFTDLMDQWRSAYNNLPAEMTISVDDEKNFTITYANQQIIHPAQNKIPENVKYRPTIRVDNEEFINIEFKKKHYNTQYGKNEKLNLFAGLLTSSIPLSDFLTTLKIAPYEYYNEEYVLEVIENRILVYEKSNMLKALPPFDKFLDLIVQWKSITLNKPKTIRLYMDDKYNFRLIPV